MYIRHAHRDKWPNVTAFDLYEYTNGIEDASQSSFKRAVCLSDMGVEEAKLLGRLFEKFGVPVGPVHTSPSCRAKQTAKLAFGKYDAIDKALFIISFNEYLGKPDPLLDFLKNVEIKSGRNTILVGHTNRLEPHQGKGVAGKFSHLQEPGLHILERTGDKKLTVVFSIPSLHELAVNGGLIP